MEAPARAHIARSQQAIVDAYTAIALLYCLATVWLFLSVAANTAVAVVHAVAFAVIAVNYGVLRVTRDYVMATHVILFVGTLVVSSLFATGGWEGTGYLWTFAYLPYALFLASARVAWTWVGILVGVDGLLLAADAAGRLDIPYTPVQLGVFAASLAIFLMVMFLFQAAVLRSEARSERRAEEAETARARLDEAQAIARIGNWDWDPRGDRIEWSKELYRIFGEDPDRFEPSFQGYMERVHPEDRPRLEAVVGRSLSDGHPFTIEYRILLGDGTTVWLRSEGGVEQDPEGEVTRLVGTSQDVTERRLAEAREQEIETLKRINRFKSEFLNSAAHELATPLTPIQLQVEMMKRALGEGERVPHELAIIDRNVDRLGRLIKDLLDGARMESGRLRLDRRSVDLAAMVRDAARVHADMAERQEVELRVEADGPLPVEADEGRIAQILDNLLTNALKYTRPGGHVRVTARGDEGGLRVDVEDDGIGFDPARAGDLFQPFSQVHDTTEELRIGGTGLGLYICRGLVEAHGGRIGAHSDGDGKGSRFWFTLPAQSEDGPADG